MVAQPVTSPQTLPLPFHGSIEAGFPSPAADYEEDTLDLARFLIRRQASTFVMKAKGHSMVPTVNDGDLLIVDKSIHPKHGQVVIACVNGEFTVKRIYQKEGFTSLQPDNKDFSPIVFEFGNELQIWGVVIFIIHSAHVCPG